MNEYAKENIVIEITEEQIKENFLEFMYTKEKFEKLVKMDFVKTNNVNELKLTDKELLFYMHEFFKYYTPDYFYQAFTSFMELTLLNITPSDNSCADGEHLLVDKKFHVINLSTIGAFDDVAVFAHECAHAIDTFLNPRDKTLLLKEELISTFIELLCCKYFSLNGLDDESIEYQKRYFNMYLDVANEYNKLFEKISKAKSKQAIANIINEANIYKFHYTLNYINAINLLKMYDKNPRFTFDLIKNIIYLDEFIGNHDLFMYLNRFGLFNIDSFKDYHEYLDNRNIIELMRK